MFIRMSVNCPVQTFARELPGANVHPDVRELTGSNVHPDVGELPV
jgi:hypothetical protein